MPLTKIQLISFSCIQAAYIYSYVGGYNFVNATLAPLRDTKFNKLKSELKVVEAGWMNKAIIASETIPYTDVIKHGENGFLVAYNKPKDWYKYIKQLILDPDLRKGLADNLTRDIKKQFNVRVGSIDTAPRSEAGASNTTTDTSVTWDNVKDLNDDLDSDVPF